MQLTTVLRREGHSPAPQMTPWEENSEHIVEQEGNAYFYDKVRETQIATRKPRRRVAFFLQPTGVDGKWGDWFAATFLTPKVVLAPREGSGIPRGFFTVEDQRRNIAVPSTISYGDYVGEADGVAPYGLE